MRIANVALTNTFDTWRIRSNQVFTRLNQFAVNESRLYANTLTANVRFVSLGATKLGDANNDIAIVNGTLTANGRVSIATNITVGGNTTTNKLTVTSSLSSSGNTTLGDAAADRLTLNGNTVSIGAAVLSIDTGLLFLQKNANRVGVNTLTPNTAFHVNGVVFANSGFRFPDGAITTAPLYVYASNGSQLYP